MLRHLAAAAAGFSVLVFGAGSGAAQDWSPPSSEMPAMPQMSQFPNGWQQSLGPWTKGIGGAGNLRATGEASPNRERARFVRFHSGARPVAVWTDRNGDGRCDMLEILKSGVVAFQLVDADFDGRANVLRVFDASGSLAREDRF